MNDDKTLINKLWWLRKFLNEEWNDKEYKDICNDTLNEDICKEVDAIVQHIKENY